MNKRFWGTGHPGQLGFLFLALAALTWRRSGDPLIDWGRELYTALSVSEGWGIPLDVLVLFGPVSPLINGIVLSWSSGNTTAILVSNLAFLGIALVVSYHIAHRLFGRRTAFSSSLVFLFLTGFPMLTGVGNYNFLTPYSHGATHGLLFGFICLASLFRGLESGSARLWSLAGACAALAVCSKPEIGVSTFLTLAFGVATSLRLHPGRVAGALSAGLGFILTLGLIALSVGQLPGVSPLVVLEPYRSALQVSSLDLPFYSWSSGFRTGLRQALTGIVIFAVLLLIGLSAAGSRKSVEHRRAVPDIRQSFLWSVAIAALLFVVFNIVFPFAWLKLARALPWTALATFVVCVRTVFFTCPPARSRSQVQRASEVGLLALFSAAMLFKTGLDTRFDQYGFVLSAPATLLGIGLLSHDIPARARLIGSSPHRARILAQVVVLLLVLSAASQSTAFYSRRTVPLAYGSDLLFITSAEFDPRTPTVLRLLTTVDELDQFRDGALMLPEGSMFHYLLRARSAVPLASLMPLELELVGTRRVIGMVKKADPAVVIVVEPDLSLWSTLGKQGDHPYSTLRDWIAARYQEQERFGNDSPDLYRLEVVVFQSSVTRNAVAP